MYVISMAQKTQTVRIARELVGPLKKLVEELKDEYDMPLFESQTDAVTQAVKDFLKKHMKRSAAK